MFYIQFFIYWTVKTRPAAAHAHTNSSNQTCCKVTPQPLPLFNSVLDLNWWVEGAVRVIERRRRLFRQQLAKNMSINLPKQGPVHLFIFFLTSLQIFPLQTFVERGLDECKHFFF